MFTWAIGIVCSHLTNEESKVLHIIGSKSRTQILVCLRAEPIFCPCNSSWWRWDSMNTEKINRDHACTHGSHTMMSSNS